ncbi:hypothetical protein COLO4_07843 [Corchorus olitorius]|uniref:Protein kinase domain-containing protein n=1 Tax=Corchorus olitorius TaxID=93759 RepID=A0A1R3KIE0_9ROSI|nr:hypothetical protein COLO4_07843 [Corchorus olitorius]
MLDHLKKSYPNGFEEAIIASILKETLRGLEYLHRQGYIHRDVKAGSVLLHHDGTVLLMIMSNALPKLDSNRDKKFSKSFKDMVAMCLVKDPSKRPTTEKLLKHSFFKHAKPPQQTLDKLFEHMEPNANDQDGAQPQVNLRRIVPMPLPLPEQKATSNSHFQE